MAAQWGRIDGWWNDSTEDDSPCSARSLGPPTPGSPTVLIALNDEVSLDIAFALIDGTQSGGHTYSMRLTPADGIIARVRWKITKRGPPANSKRVPLNRPTLRDTRMRSEG